MKKKIISMALVFMLLAIPAAYLQIQRGVLLDGRFFVKKTADLYACGNDSIVITRTEDGADFSVVLGGEALDAALLINDNAYVFQYGDGREVTGYAGKWSDELVNSDGMPLGWMDGFTVYIGEMPTKDAMANENSLSNVLYRMYEGICEQKGHVLVVLCAMLIYAVGTASIFWPEEVHFLGKRWAYSNAELSDAGIAVQKITGVACTVVGVVLLYAPLFW